MADRPPPATALPLADAAGLLGGYRWIEQRLFELTGRWAVEAPAPQVRLYLDEVSSQHAWHAELFAARLPVLDGADHEALTRPPEPAAGPLLEALADPGTGGGGSEPLLSVRRTAGLCRVMLPRLLATYARHLSRTVTVTDGPTARALRLVIRDETDTWQAGETLLQELLTGPVEVSVAAATQERLESLVAGAGVGAGLVRWPGGDSAASWAPDRGT